MLAIFLCSWLCVSSVMWLKSLEIMKNTLGQESHSNRVDGITVKTACDNAPVMKYGCGPMANSSMSGLRKHSYIVMQPGWHFLLLIKTPSPPPLFCFISVKHITLHTWRSLQFLTKALSSSILLTSDVTIPITTKGKYVLLNQSLLTGPRSIP